jgi:hypothetical protein
MSLMETEMAFVYRRSKAAALKQHGEFVRMLSDAEKMDDFGGVLTALIGAFDHHPQGKELLDSYGYGMIDLHRDRLPEHRHIRFSVHSNMRDALLWREFAQGEKTTDLILDVTVEYQAGTAAPQLPNIHPCNPFNSLISNRYHKMHRSPTSLLEGFMATLYEMGFRLADFWCGVVELRHVLNVELKYQGFTVSIVFDLNTMEESHTLLEMMVLQQQTEGVKKE